MTSYNFEVTNDQQNHQISEERILKTAAKMMAFLEKDILKTTFLADYDLAKITLNADIMICDNEQMRQINKEYRDKDSATDVITFALFADDEDSRMVFDNNIHLGEIIISSEQTQIQADENGKTFDEEFDFLLCHGILHLLGFDHMSEETYDSMIKLQEQMLKHV